MIKLTMGCDPEIFIFDKVKDRIVPAIGLIGGTKDEPIPIDGGSYQLDGTLLEFGIDPNGDIGKVVNGIRAVLSAKFGDRYELRCGASAGYHPEDLPNNHPALNVGCSPQFRMVSATKLEQVRGVPKLDPRNIPAGGHIHVGFTEGADISDPALLKPCWDFTRVLLQLYHTSGDLRRDQVLGGSRCVMRIKPYGFEWRNPSGEWLADSRVFEEITKLITEYTKHLTGETNTEPHHHSLVKICSLYAAIRNKAARVDDKYQGTLPLDY